MANKRLGKRDLKLVMKTIHEFDKVAEGKTSKYWKPSIVSTTLATAKEVRLVRVRTGLSQDVFASILGRTAQTVRNWEGGRVHPGAMESKVLRLIASEKNPKRFMQHFATL